jgi:hypothetical protein
MAILQASSTQNDLVVSSFVMSFGLFMLRINKDPIIENFLFAGISLGLALLTKGTAYLYCAAIGTVLAFPLLLKNRIDLARFLQITAALFSVVVFALMMNVGHLSRNYKMYGHPLSTEGVILQNTDLSAAALIANIARNGALHLGVPSDRINGYLERVMQVTLGSQLNNPLTTWVGSSFEIPFSRNENMAGNLFHMIIGILGVIVLPVLWLQGLHTKVIWYAFGAILGAIFYCWILKWQPWASRLHLPLFALASPLLTIIVTAVFGGTRKWLGNMILLIMVLYSLVFVFANKNRSLMSFDWYHKDRMELYFNTREDLFKDYEQATSFLLGEKPQDVGLLLDWDDWEYPFWAFVNQTTMNGGGYSFTHVGVNNISRNLDEIGSLPLFVLATKEIDDWNFATKYSPVFISYNVSVYKKMD